MKKRNGLFTGLLLLLAAAALSACGSPKVDMQAIYTDDAKIAAQGDSYTYQNRLGSVDTADQLDLEYQGFSGSDTIWSLEVNADSPLEVTCDSRVSSGDFKAVLVTPEKTVEVICEGTQAGEKTFDLKAGSYALKLVGRQASGEVKIALNPGGAVTLETVEH